LTKALARIKLGAVEDGARKMICVGRRKALLLALGGAASVVTTFKSAPGAAQTRGGAGIERWMDSWMNARSAVSGPLHVSRFKEPVYVLLKPIAWSPNPNQQQKHTRVEVPKGFVTDFASIPRIFWSMLRPDGDYTYPAIIHDHLYWAQDRSRQVADEIFRFAMEDFGIASTPAAAIFNAVRVGGGSAWDANAALKAKGERRVLQDFPDDPTVRWRDWKKRPGVFAS
jgi:hypothetical protein